MDLTDTNYHQHLCDVGLEEMSIICFDFFGHESQRLRVDGTMGGDRNRVFLLHAWPPCDTFDFNKI